MAIDVVQKVKNSDDQPKGGKGVINAGQKALSAADKIDSNHTINHPISSSKIDQTIDVMYDNLKGRFDDYNTYSA